MKEKIMEKLKILADAAKYDVSCSSSGVERKNNGKIGNSRDFGICHTWSADGRCVSLLKILLSNRCVYNCKYCVNRREAEVTRASFEPEELAELTIEFYRRNYIEGLFLSSAVEGSPDATTEKMIKTLHLLRNEHGFAGYIHAKIIPGTDASLVAQIGFLADRVSVNMELPSAKSLSLLAPQKTPQDIAAPMKFITDAKAEFKLPGKMKAYQIQNYQENAMARRKKKGFVPAGQTTQMIIGATKESDCQIVRTSERLYQSLGLRRVYYSAYIPMVESSLLPSTASAPPMVREHRLYQADWLLRFYHFRADEILDQNHPFLDLELDPKIAWALRNIELFPVEINRASLEELLRIPGIGATGAYRILRQRKVAHVHFDQLKSMGVVVKRAKYFITCKGKYYAEMELDNQKIRDALILPKERIQTGEEQLSFDFAPKKS